MTDANFDLVATAVGAPGQPEALFAALDAGMKATIGHRLFTILVIHPGARESQRYYSNQPQAYPVGGRKPTNETHWFQRVIGQGEPYIGYTYEDIADVFFDHELIRSLGCESVLNMPVRWNGQTLGTINLLDAAGHYRPDHVPMARLFSALAVPGLLKVIGQV